MDDPVPVVLLVLVYVMALVAALLIVVFAVTATVVAYQELKHYVRRRGNGRR